MHILFDVNVIDCDILIFQMDKELASGEYFLKENERKAKKRAERKVKLLTVNTL